MAEKRVATIYDYARFLTEQCCKGSCDSCPLWSQNNEFHMRCGKYIREHTEAVNEILLKWIDEHPIKTYKDDFIEKFPKASKSESTGVLLVCRKNIYGGKCDNCGCENCWNEPYKESEDEE